MGIGQATNTSAPISAVGKKVPTLPMPAVGVAGPWPSFAISPQTRQAIAKGQFPQTTLAALAAPTIVHTAPPGHAVPATRPLPPPPNAKRTAGPAIVGVPGAPPLQASTGVSPRMAPPTPAVATTPPAANAASTGHVVAAPPGARRWAGPAGAQSNAQPGKSVPLAPVQASGAKSALTPPRMPGPRTMPGAPIRTSAPAPATASRPIPTAGAPTERLALAAFILGWLSIVLAFVAGIPAVITGIMALRSSHPVWTLQRVRNQARAGIALGSATTLIWTVLILLAMQR